MSGCPWTLPLSLSVDRCRLPKKRHDDDIVGMQLNVIHPNPGHQPAATSLLTTPLTVGARMTDHRRQVGVHLVEQVRDLAKTPVNRVQTGRHSPAIITYRLTHFGWSAATQHSDKVLGMPAKRDRQRFERSRATAPLDGVMLKFAHDRLGDVRALRELALTPPEFIHALFDGVRNSYPILRHVFLRAPPSRRG